MAEGAKSYFWQDLVHELTAWLEDIHVALEDPDGTLIDKALHRLGGNAETLRRVLALPAILLAQIEANEERIKRESQTNEEE
jgi:hypothetical protein